MNMDTTNLDVGDDKKATRLTMDLGNLSIASMITKKSSNQSQALSKCPFLASERKKWPKPKILKRIPLSTIRGTHVVSKVAYSILLIG